MPRRDAPGALHHVTFRGVGQRDIFVDDVDRQFLFDRIGIVAKESGASILAFAFMSNHVHILSRTGSVPLATVMARIETAHAMHFNRRHGRVGVLFQNRYYAKPVESGAHLLVGIRYIHANPLAAGIVAGLDALERYPWTGHAAVMGTAPPGIVDVPAALGEFGPSPRSAREALREFMRGWRETEAKESSDDLPPLRLTELDAEIERVAHSRGVSAREILEGSRRRAVCRAREAVACQAIALGLAASEVALILRVTHTSLLRCVQRARRQ
jgi:REP element-mobilizing transposase RayT